ncbi:dentin sialophosphoprotein-like isoform X1 [Syngnathus scovelli]|uniref:dentin sialophosphoprotein-like isoform X1 n=1 Tax=Syngnathus scovelli TaxID=161590 RepID=UPI00210FF5F6|nr:dentin sialophosphoprotein-like isoform X1 [Syngnathus scovelli]
MFPRCVTPLPTVLPTLLPLVTLAVLSLSAPLALPDKSAALLAPLDGKATRQAVTTLPAATESGDTSNSPDGDDSQGQAQAQPNDEDLNRMDREGASDAPDSDCLGNFQELLPSALWKKPSQTYGAAEGPAVSVTESKESAESAGSIKSHGSTESSESVDIQESVESAESPDIQESAESAETSESVDIQESAESSESADLQESAESAESVTMQRSTESSKSVVLQESAESHKSAESAESVASLESAESSESAESAKFAESAESTESFESAESPESADSAEPKESPQLTESRESTELLYSVKFSQLEMESSSEAGKDSEKKTSNDSEPGDTIDDGGNGLDPMAAFDLEDGDAMEEEIREEDETSSKDDKGSDANVGTADAELGVDDIKAEHNDQDPKESYQIFDSTEATLVEKSDATPSHLRE